MRETCFISSDVGWIDGRARVSGNLSMSQQQHDLTLSGDLFWSHQGNCHTNLGRGHTCSVYIKREERQFIPLMSQIEFKTWLIEICDHTSPYICRQPACKSLLKLLVFGVLLCTRSPLSPFCPQCYYFLPHYFLSICWITLNISLPQMFKGNPILADDKTDEQE